MSELDINTLAVKNGSELQHVILHSLYWDYRKLSNKFTGWDTYINFIVSAHESIYIKTESKHFLGQKPNYI